MAIPAPDGGRYFVDFGLDDVNAWGEYDGEAKYLDAELRGEATLERTLLQEKFREDWIRGTTNRRYPRWGKTAITSCSSLGIRLANFHVLPPRDDDLTLTSRYSGGTSRPTGDCADAD